MTNATEPQNPDRAELLRERFGPDIEPMNLHGAADDLPPAHAQRVHIIAALYAVAAFFAFHGDVPAPATVQLHCPVLTMAELEAVALAYDTPIYGDRPQVSVRLEIPGTYAVALVYLSNAEHAARPL